MNAGLGMLWERSHSHLSAGSKAWAKAEKRRRVAEAKVALQDPVPVGAYETGVGPRKGHPAIVVRVWQKGRLADVQFLNRERETERRVYVTMLLRKGVDRRYFVPGRGGFEDVPLPLHLDAIARLWQWDAPAKASLHRDGVPSAPPSTPIVQDDGGEDEEGRRRVARSMEEVKRLERVPTYSREEARLGKIYDEFAVDPRPHWTDEFAKPVPSSQRRAMEAQNDRLEDAKFRPSSTKSSSSSPLKSSKRKKAASTAVLQRVREAQKEASRPLARHEVEALAQDKARRAAFLEAERLRAANVPTSPYAKPLPGMRKRRKPPKHSTSPEKHDAEDEEEEDESDPARRGLGPVPALDQGIRPGSLEWALRSIERADTSAKRTDSAQTRRDDLAKDVAAAMSAMDAHVMEIWAALSQGEEAWDKALTLSQRQRAFTPLTNLLRRLRPLVIRVVAAVRKWQQLPDRPEWDIPKEADDVINPEDAPSTKKYDWAKSSPASKPHPPSEERPWIWQGQHWYVHLSTLLDPLARSSSLRLWYGPAYRFRRNPLCLPQCLDEHPLIPCATRRWRWVAGVMELRPDADLVQRRKHAIAHSEAWLHSFRPAPIPGSFLGAVESARNARESESQRTAKGAAPLLAELMWDRDQLDRPAAADSSVNEARAAAETLDAVAGGAIQLDALGGHALVEARVLNEAYQSAGLEPNQALVTDDPRGIPFWWPCRDMDPDAIQQARIAAAGILDAESRGW